MKRILIVLIFFSVGSAMYASLGTELGYGKAVSCAQAGDWKQAQESLSCLVVDAPDRFDLLYDNGVAAYRLSEHDKAAAYFQTVVRSGAPDALKKQAHFNLGNAHVALKKLPEAVADYQAVLAIEPSNEPARHNLQKVRQMMQEQNKQDQQNNQDDKNKDSQDQQQDDNSGQGQSQDQKQGQDQQQKDGDKENKENSESGKEPKKEKPSQKQDGQEKNKPDKKSDKQNASDKNKQLGDDNHDSSSMSKKDDSQPTKNDAKEQEIQAGAIEDNEQERKKEENEQLLAQLGPDKKWMAGILNRQEKADEKAQKRLVKATVDKELAGRHGQNCW